MDWLGGGRHFGALVCFLLLVASIWFRSSCRKRFGLERRGDSANQKSPRPVRSHRFWRCSHLSSRSGRSGINPFPAWVMQGEQMEAFKFLGLNVGRGTDAILNAILVVLILLPIMTLGLYPLLENSGYVSRHYGACPRE